MTQIEKYIDSRTVRQLLIIAVLIAVLFVAYQNKELIIAKFESK